MRVEEEIVEGLTVSVRSSIGPGSEVDGVGSGSVEVGGMVVVVEVVGTVHVSVMVMFWRLASSTRTVAAAASSS